MILYLPGKYTLLKRVGLQESIYMIDSPVLFVIWLLL